MWPLEAVDVLQRFAVSTGVEDFEIYGSATDSGLLDRWSDVDVCVRSRDTVHLGEWLQRVGNVWTFVLVRAGQSTHTCRAVFDTARRLDLTVEAPV